MRPDLFEAPDYYNIDELLSDEHKLVRDAARQWVKRDVSPIIEEYAQKAEFPKQIICLLYTSPSPRDLSTSRMPSSA